MKPSPKMAAEHDVTKHGTYVAVHDPGWRISNSWTEESNDQDFCYL
jgi:hypothetical protein